MGLTACHPSCMQAVYDRVQVLVEAAAAAGVQVRPACWAASMRRTEL